MQIKTNYFGKLIGIVSALCLISGCGLNRLNDHSNENEVLRVGISPYQDIGMIVNEKNLGLEKKYGTKLELVTMAWEDIVPAMASAGRTVDVGFAGLVDCLGKSQNMNVQGDDPIIFVYPAYVFKGGCFLTFNPAVPTLDAQTLKNPEIVKRFLSFKIGAQKPTDSELLVYKLARQVGLKPSQLHVVNMSLNDSLLAAENGSLDIIFGGPTQQTEVLKRKGHVVLTADDLGFVDITGFACKQSVWNKRRKDIESLIRIWFDCANYVTSDLDHHSDKTLAYLDANASTQYTLPEYKRALTREYFPKTIAEASKEILSDQGKYSINRISRMIGDYLVEMGVCKSRPLAPHIIPLTT